MHLIATAPQRVRLQRLGLVVELAEAEGIWTESSYKFTRESTETMLAEAGLAIDAWYTDAEGRFGLVLAQPLSPKAAGWGARRGVPPRRGGECPTLAAGALRPRGFEGRGGPRVRGRVPPAPPH